MRRCATYWRAVVVTRKASTARAAHRRATQEGSLPTRPRPPPHPTRSHERLRKSVRATPFSAMAAQARWSRGGGGGYRPQTHAP
eukprot:1127331-Pleurochrysis_carterae.AAC.1